MPLATPGDTLNVLSFDSIDVYTAPTGTTGPTDTATALNVAFKLNGLMSDDELTSSLSVDRNELRALAGKLVRVKRIAQTRSFSWTFLENSHQVWTIANPGSTAATTTGITTRTVKSQTKVDYAMVIQATEGTNIVRFWIPVVELFSDGDRTLGPSGMWSTPMSAMVYPNASDVFYFEITNHAAASTT